MVMKNQIWHLLIFLTAFSEEAGKDSKVVKWLGSVEFEQLYAYLQDIGAKSYCKILLQDTYIPCRSLDGSMTGRIDDWTDQRLDGSEKAKVR